MLHKLTYMSVISILVIVPIDAHFVKHESALYSLVRVVYPSTLSFILDLMLILSE